MIEKVKCATADFAAENVKKLLAVRRVSASSHWRRSKGERLIGARRYRERMVHELIYEAGDVHELFAEHSRILEVEDIVLIIDSVLIRIESALNRY